MRAYRLVAVVWIAFAAAVAPPLLAAEPAREMHGMADAFAAPGMTLAWGILRGANEAATVVVLRIVADPVEFPAIAATGTDPFTQRTIPLLIATANSGKLELRVSRAHFADFPRTDIKFLASASAAPSDAPKAIVYYLGVPDTTPEFATDAALDAYLVERLARARTGAAK
ncbi:MAG: hypothetical protein ABI724_12425 [Betaproteobacteria bacterium]